MRKIAIAMVMAGGLTLAGGGTARAQFVAGYAEPEAPCEVSMGHFLVNSAHLYMMHASDGKYADQVPKLMRDAKAALLNALSQGQESNPAVWFMLARWYEMERDLPGADSMYTRAERMEPKCTKDIQKHRKVMWAEILNVGVDAQKRGDDKAARAQFVKANSILSTEPTTYYYIANIAASESQRDVFVVDSLRRQGAHADSIKADSVSKLADVAIDSAIVNYRIALRYASDSAHRTVAEVQEMRTTATFNVARLFHRRKMWDSAAAYYAKVRETHPNDAQALTGLATVYSAAGKAASAQALYDTVIVLADSLDPLDLFAAGVELFKVNAFDRAAMAIRLGLKRDPYYRDALYNLANSYLSQGNDIQQDIDSISDAAAKRPVPPPTRAGRGGRGAAAPARPDTSAIPKLRVQLRQVGDSMLVACRRLIDVDPHSKIPQRLLAQAFKFKGNDDSTLAAVQRVHDMTYDVEVTQMDQSATGAAVQGRIITSPGAAVTVPTITFDFLDKDGKVVSSGTVAGESQPANTARPFNVHVTGAKIAAWRYKTGS